MMKHTYWGVRCVECSAPILLKDHGPYVPYDPDPSLEDLPHDTFSLRCFSCRHTDQYNRDQLELVIQEAA